MYSWFCVLLKNSVFINLLLFKHKKYLFIYLFFIHSPYVCDKRIQVQVVLKNSDCSISFPLKSPVSPSGMMKVVSSSPPVKFLLF